MKGRWRIPLSRPSITDRDRAAVGAVLEGSVLSGGEATARFEELATERLGRATVLCSSGTAGLFLALRALGVTGGEVLTPSLGFIASAHAIRLAGATPRFVDVDRDTLCVTAETLEAAWTPEVSAILPVDLFGTPLPKEVFDLARDRGVPSIEDACEAFGSSVDGIPCGALGDIGVFGFYPNKTITLGEGGLLACGDEATARRVRSIANQGRTGPDMDFSGDGFNFRISELQAALGVAQIERLDSLIAARAAVAGRYREGLAAIGGITTLSEVPPPSKRSWFAQVVILEEASWRQGLREHLGSCGIETGLYFPPVHRFHPYDSAPIASGGLPVTDDLAARTVALPFHAELTPDEVDEVLEQLRRALEPLGVRHSQPEKA